MAPPCAPFQTASPLPAASRPSRGTAASNSRAIAADIARRLTRVDTANPPQAIAEQYAVRQTGLMQGTLILTAHGPRPVETLRRGDLVATLLPRGPFLVPIAWIGYRRASASCTDRRRAWPVLIRRDAIGPSIPSRDVLLAPEHAVYLGEALYLARMLVNGASIAFQRPADPAPFYWGFQLDIPNVVVAQNLAVESLMPAATAGYIIAAAPTKTPRPPRDAGRPALRLVKG